MPRPSMKTERKEQVLAAYVRAVSKHGLSGATLETIAGEAAMTRPLVRHHLGNKEEMFEQLVEHIVGEFSRQTRLIADALPESRRIAALIELLFGMPEDTTAELIFVFAELTLKSVSDKALAARLCASIAEFENLLAAEVIAEFPAASVENTRAVAHGIMAIYFNNVSLAPLAPNTHDARNAVGILIQSLEPVAQQTLKQREPLK